MFIWFFRVYEKILEIYLILEIQRMVCRILHYEFSLLFLISLKITCSTVLLKLRPKTGSTKDSKNNLAPLVWYRYSVFLKQISIFFFNHRKEIDVCQLIV